MKFKLTFILLAFTIPVAQAQSIDDILAKHIKNSGGEEAWKSVNTIKIIAKISLPQGEMKTTIQQMKPNMIHSESEVMGQKIVQAFDGETAWMINPMTGSTAPQVMNDMLKEQFVDNTQGIESDWIDYAQKGHEVTLEGKETIDGVETFKVKLIKNKNNDKKESTLYFFFDTEKYMPIAMRVTPDAGPTAGMEVMTKLSDYKETNTGILMPHHIETSTMGQTTELIFEEIIMNADIDESLFKMPTE